MMMNPNILNQNPLMFFDRAVNAQRSQLLTVMADAVSECRTAADQAAELNETGQVGLLRLAEVWSAIRAKEGMGGLILEGTEAKILSDVVAQFYAYLSGCALPMRNGLTLRWKSRSVKRRKLRPEQIRRRPISQRKRSGRRSLTRIPEKRPRS